MHCFLLLACLGTASGFVPTNYASTPLVGRPTITTNTQLGALAETVDTARTAFFIWFFGTSGGAGVALSNFPRMYSNVQAIQSMKDAGPSLGGETLGLTPWLVGYPRDLYLKDIQAVVKNKLTVEQMVDKFPIENNFLSSRGYLTYEAFQQANSKANPLTVRAIFDTFAQSTDVVEPDVAQAKLDEYKENVYAIKGALLQSKLIGYLAIFTLLFLLGFACAIAAGHAYHGWYVIGRTELVDPICLALKGIRLHLCLTRVASCSIFRFPDWPGGQNFPACLLDPKTGPWTIPDYWLSDP